MAAQKESGFGFCRLRGGFLLAAVAKCLLMGELGLCELTDLRVKSRPAPV